MGSLGAYRMLSARSVRIGPCVPLWRMDEPPIHYPLSVPLSHSAGPGVGKGRQISATIMENFAKGRTKVGKLHAPV